jgi:hypothetical protein
MEANIRQIQPPGRRDNLRIKDEALKPRLAKQFRDPPPQSHRNAADGPKDPLRAEGLFLVLLPNEEVYLEVCQARTLVGHRVLLVEHMYRPSLRTHFFAQ